MISKQQFNSVFSLDFSCLVCAMHTYINNILVLFLLLFCVWCVDNGCNGDGYINTTNTALAHLTCIICFRGGGVQEQDTLVWVFVCWLVGSSSRLRVYRFRRLSPPLSWLVLVFRAPLRLWVPRYWGPPRLFENQSAIASSWPPRRLSRRPWIYVSH